MSQNNLPEWARNAVFTSPSFIEHEVNGATKRFYAMRAKFVTQLKGLSKEVAAAFAALFVDTSTDTSSKTKTTIEGGPDGLTQTETTADAISPELAQLRFDLKRKTAEDLIDAFLNEKNHELFAAAIMSSMRDDFPKGKSPTPAEFLEEVDAPTFISMLVGAVKANKGVLGSLGKTLGDLAQVLVQSAVTKAAGQVAGLGLDQDSTTQAATPTLWDAAGETPG